MTGLLLDTHVVLWWLDDDRRLPATAAALIADPTTTILVSAASVWEIAIKRALGKLQAPDALPESIAEQGFEWLPIGPSHAWAVRELPRHHGDPFDRLLIAQASVEQLPIVTADRRFGDYGVDVRW